MEAKELSKNLRVDLPEYEYSLCPVCKKSFDGGLILDKFKELRDNLKELGLLETNENKFFNQTDEEFSKVIEESYHKPYKFSEIIGVEISELYDGIIAFTCPNCNSFWARFTGEYLGESLTADELMAMKDKLNKIQIIKNI